MVRSASCVCILSISGTSLLQLQHWEEVGDVRSALAMKAGWEEAELVCEAGWRCWSERSLVTSDSRSFTLSARTQDLVSSSLNCDSFKASCSLHRNRARCDTSRSMDPGLRASPFLTELVLDTRELLDSDEGWETLVKLVAGREGSTGSIVRGCGWEGEVTGDGGLEDGIDVVVVP